MPEAATIKQRADRAIASVVDPEMPFMSIEDLGMVRAVTCGDDAVEVTITPTYLGCPAFEVIQQALRAALTEAGIAKVKVTTELSPSWSSDLVSEAGRRKLKEFGVAPPAPCGGHEASRNSAEPPTCTTCGSRSTEELSRFGPTACKALWRCLSCRDPFEVMKCH